MDKQTKETILAFTLYNAINTMYVELSEEVVTVIFRSMQKLLEDDSMHDSVMDTYKEYQELWSQKVM